MENFKIDQLQTELYKSELLRVNILIGVYIVSAIVFVFLSYFYADELTRVQLGNNQIHYVYIFMACVLTYELLVKFTFTRYQKSGKTLTQLMQFGNAFEETLIPTFAILIFMQSNNPILFMNSPSVYLYFVFIILSILRLNWKISLFTGISSAIQFLILFLYAYSDSDLSKVPEILRVEIIYIMKIMLMLIAGAAAAFVANQIRKHTIATIRTIQDRNHILKIFGQHVSPQVALELLKTDESTRSKLANVCVMFLDIRGFTSYAEKRDPEEIVRLLNEFFEHSIEIVNKYDGIIHQLLGDGFMAIFGAPIPTKNHSDSAVNAAKEISDRIRALEINGRNIPIGIGLHSGEALTGTVGSKLHKEYKVTGDVVNLAARIESLNKEYDSQLLISENVWNELEIKPNPKNKFQNVDIRGREQHVTIYQLL